MTTSYSSFANLGYKVEPHFIKKIVDSKGNILYENKEEKELILNQSLTFILNEMLTYTYNKNFIDYNYPTLISLLPNITHKYSIKSGTTDTDLLIIPSNVVGVLVNPITGVIANDNDTKKEMFFYIKGTEPTLNGTTKDLDAVFKEENSLNEQKEAP